MCFRGHPKALASHLRPSTCNILIVNILASNWSWKYGKSLYIAKKNIRLIFQEIFQTMFESIFFKKVLKMGVPIEIESTAVDHG